MGLLSQPEGCYLPRMATKTLAAVGLAALLSATFLDSVTAVEPPVPRQSTTLAEQLKAGLKARLPEEFAYADRVAALVEQGVLPVKLVDTAFAWARKKGVPYPFPYFRRVLEIQASLIGVKI